MEAAKQAQLRRRTRNSWALVSDAVMRRRSFQAEQERQLRTSLDLPPPPARQHGLQRDTSDEATGGQLRPDRGAQVTQVLCDPHTAACWLLTDDQPPVLWRGSSLEEDPDAAAAGAEDSTDGGSFGSGALASTARYRVSTSGARLRHPRLSAVASAATPDHGGSARLFRVEHSRLPRRLSSTHTLLAAMAEAAGAPAAEHQSPPTDGAPSSPAKDANPSQPVSSPAQDMPRSPLSPAATAANPLSAPSSSRTGDRPRRFRPTLTSIRGSASGAELGATLPPPRSPVSPTRPSFPQTTTTTSSSSSSTITSARPRSGRAAAPRAARPISVPRAIYVSRCNAMLGWTPGQPGLMLLSNEMVLVAQCPTPSPVSTVVYSEATGTFYVGCCAQVLAGTVRLGQNIRLRPFADLGTESARTSNVAVTALALDDNVGAARVFVGFQTAVLVFEAGGTLLTTIRNAHGRALSALLFVEELDVLYSAAKDGTLKVWDSQWQLRCMLPGHELEITQIARHPVPGLAITTSRDCSICVWSLDIEGILYKCTTLEPVLGLCFTACPTRFLSWSADRAELWSIQHYHDFFALVERPVLLMQRAESSQRPPRILTHMADSSLALISPVSGSIITALPTPAAALATTNSSDEDDLDEEGLVEGEGEGEGEGQSGAGVEASGSEKRGPGLVSSRAPSRMRTPAAASHLPSSSSRPSSGRPPTSSRPTSGRPTSSRPGSSFRPGSSRPVPDHTRDPTKRMRFAGAVVSAAYSSSLDTAFCLMENGVIYLLSAASNPLTELTMWPAPTDSRDRCTILTLMETVYNAKDDSRAHATWPSLVNRVIRDKAMSILFGGTLSGKLITFDHEIGCRRAMVSNAHTQAVSHMVAVASSRMAISASEDMCIRTWSICVSRGGDLEPLHTFFAPSLPAHLAAFDNRMGLALQPDAGGVSGFFVYALTENECYCHSPSHDHTAPITSAAAMASLRIFVTTDTTGLIKIWDDQNDLMTQVAMNTPITSCCFLNSEGHLLIATLNNIFKVPCDEFLPARYRRRNALTLHVQDPLEEPIPSVHLDGGTLSLQSYAIRERRAKRQLMLADRERQRFAEEQERLHQRTRLAERDRELARLLNRRLHQDMRPTHALRVSKRALARYLAVINPGIDSYAPIHELYKGLDNMSDADADSRADLSEEQVRLLLARAEAMPDNQRGPALRLFYQSVAVLGAGSGLEPPPVAPDGMVPNSIVWRALRKYGAEQEPEPAWQPPQLRPDQLDAKRCGGGHSDDEEDEDDRNGALMALALAEEGDDGSGGSESEEEQEEEDFASERQRGGRRRAQTSFRALSPRHFEQAEGGEDEVEPQTPTEVKSPTPPPTPPPVGEPERPPLPRFITQFRGEAWFDHHFPRALPKNFDHLRPPSLPNGQFMQIPLSKFIALLAEGPDCLLKTTGSLGRMQGIALALAQLSADPGFTSQDRAACCESLITLVTNSDLDIQAGNERALIAQVLGTLAAMHDASSEAIVAMLAFYVEGDSMLQEGIAEHLRALGLRDPKHLLLSHLRTMASTCEDWQEARNDIWQQVCTFLAHWEQRLVKHLQQQQRNLQAFAEQEARDDPSGVAERRASTQVSEDLARRAAPPTAIEVLNHWVFVEEERQRLMNRRGSPLMAAELSDSEDEYLVRPGEERFTSLPRLGYTRQSVCRPERETVMALPGMLRRSTAPHISDEPLPGRRRSTRAAGSSAGGVHPRAWGSTTLLHLRPSKQSINSPFADPGSGTARSSAMDVAGAAPSRRRMTAWSASSTDNSAHPATGARRNTLGAVAQRSLSKPVRDAPLPSPRKPRFSLVASDRLFIPSQTWSE